MQLLTTIFFWLKLINFPGKVFYFPEEAQGYKIRSVWKSEPGSQGVANISSFDLSAAPK